MKMFVPILLILSLAIGSVKLSARIESPEAKAEREAYHARLEAGDPEAVAEFLKREGLSFQEFYAGGKALADFDKVPVQKQ